jgi:mono/diheme cytochrome c family protein
LAIVSQSPATAAERLPPATAIAETKSAPPASRAPDRRNDSLQLDAAEKEYNAQPGQESCGFDFLLKNTSTEPIVITDVKTSCGCTVARLPSKPWRLESGSSGTLHLDVDLRGKTGTIVKSAFIETENGTNTVMLKVNIASPVASPASAGSRERAMQVALADRQSVFKGDCAKCHVEPTVGLAGKRLYDAACGICHEAEHRASMVPDLKQLAHATNADYWRAMIVAGKPGTLMPGFSSDMEGPLTKRQIDSLVLYLTQTISTHQPAPAAPRATSSHE